jgi:hypothetical protein
LERLCETRIFSSTLFLGICKCNTHWYVRSPSDENVKIHVWWWFLPSGDSCVQSITTIHPRPIISSQAKYPIPFKNTLRLTNSICFFWWLLLLVFIWSFSTSHH